LLLTEKNFIAHKAEHCRLHVEFGLDNICIALFNKEEAKHVYLEQIELTDFQKNGERTNAIVHFIKSAKLLANNYAKYVFSYVGEQSSLIPEMLFNAASKNKYFELVYTKAEDYEVEFDKVHSLDSFNIYAIPIEILKALKEKYPKFYLFHHKSVLLENLSIENKFSEKNNAYVHIHANFFDLAIFSKSKLIFSNTFTFDTKEDIMYYSLFAMEQIGLKPIDSFLYFSGKHIESKTIKTFSKKFFQLTKHKPERFLLGEFDKAENFKPDEYLTLLRLYLCA
jgi:hypothetical protein